MLEDFIAGYTECALWSSNYGEDDDDYLDDGNHELAPETVAMFEADCRAFYGALSEAIGSDVARAAGHDFWLTRCGHGAGFWDGDWSEPAATILDDASKAFRAVDLYVGGDGLIYAM